MKCFRQALICAVLPFSAAAQATADANPAAPVEAMQIELNAAAASEAGGCRLTMVTTNRLAHGLDRGAWQVAIFDAQGVVRGLPILDFGAIAQGKTKVALFELPGLACDAIGRIVVNDVAECRADDGSDQRGPCLDDLATQTRTDIEFGL